jgi:hypothetical protein
MKNVTLNKSRRQLLDRVAVEGPRDMIRKSCLIGMVLIEVAAAQ